MGCNLCNRKLQTSEPTESKEEKQETKNVDPLEFDFNSARRLIKLILSEDPLYKYTLNYIILFTNEELEHLFKGDDDYKKYPYHNIKNKFQFNLLLGKFKDFNTILFEWYKDKERYENLIKLWKKNFCIFKLKEDSDEELLKKIKDADISDPECFLEEAKDLIYNSVESKASDIKNYLKDDFNDIYSLINTSISYKEEFKKSKIENIDNITTNLTNIIKNLVIKSFPLVKNYIIKKYPKLNVLSKIQLESGMLNTLKENLIGEFEQDNTIFSKGIGFDTLSELYGAFKNGNFITKLMDEAKTHYNNPATSAVLLANSFLNLATCIKEYHDDMIKIDEINNEATKEFDKINNNFENLKKQLGELDLDNFEESMDKIMLIKHKVSENKRKLIEAVDNFDKKVEKNNSEAKTQNISSMLTYAGGVISSSIGLALCTGGLSLLAYGTAAAVNGICLGVQFYKLSQLKENLKIKQEKLKEQEKKEKEMDNLLDEINIIIDKAQDRYIPINLK